MRSASSSRGDLSFEAPYLGVEAPFPTLPGRALAASPMTMTPSSSTTGTSSRHPSIDEHSSDPQHRMPVFRQPLGAIGRDTSASPSLFSSALQPGRTANSASAPPLYGARGSVRRSSYEDKLLQPYRSSREGHRAASIDCGGAGLLPTIAAEQALASASGYGHDLFDRRVPSVPQAAFQQQQQPSDWQAIDGGFPHPFSGGPGSSSGLHQAGVLSHEQLLQLPQQQLHQRRWTASDSEGPAGHSALRHSADLSGAALQHALLQQQVLRQRGRLDHLRSGAANALPVVGYQGVAPAALPIACPLDEGPAGSGTDHLVDQLVAARVRELQLERLQFVQQLSSLQDKLHVLQMQQGGAGVSGLVQPQHLPPQQLQQQPLLQWQDLSGGQEPQWGSQALQL